MANPFGDGSSGALNVTSGTTNLLLNTKYQYTTVNVSSGATLSTSSTTGAVLYILATTSITIAGTIDLSGKINPGAGTYSVTIDGVLYSGRGVATGSAGGGPGGSTSSGFGGGGRGGQGNTFAGGTGGFGSAVFGVPGAAASTVANGNTTSEVNGVAGTFGSAGGSGAAYATVTGSNVSGANSGNSGVGGGSFGANGGDASPGSSFVISAPGGGSFGTITGGGGGAGGIAGRQGPTLVLKAPVIILTGTIITAGTNGGNGGNGGRSTFQSGPINYWGYGGGAGGGGNGGHIQLYYLNTLTDSSTKSMVGGTGGTGGSGGPSFTSVQPSGSSGTTGTLSTTVVPITIDISSGDSILTADSLLFYGVSSSISGDSTLDVVASREDLIGASVSGDSTITPDATRQFYGESSISTDSELDAIASRIAIGASTIQGDSQLSIDTTDVGVTKSSSTKTYIYKIYDRDWNYLGIWTDVKSQFGYSQEVNSAGSSINVTLARNSDSLGATYDSLADDSDDPIVTDDDNELAAETETLNSIGPGTTVDLNLYVKIYEFSSLDQDIEGDLVFTGYISRYVSQYGSNEQTDVTLFSFGADMDNWVLEDGGETRVPYLSESPDNILRDALDKFNADDGVPTYIAGTPISNVVTNLIANPGIEVSDAGWSLTSGTEGRTNGSPSPQGGYYYYVQNVSGGVSSYTTGNLVAGTTYTFSIYAKKSSGTGIITGYHNSASVFSTTAVTTSWLRYNFQFTATANSPLEIELNIIGSDNQIYVDGLMLTEGTTLYDYFDGSTTDDAIFTYAWTGTANLSTSTRSDTIGYANSSIDSTGTIVSYTFNVNTMLEVIKKCLELAPTDWFFYVDLATNIVYFKPRPTVPDHYFYLGKHILSLNLEKYIEDIVNTVYYSGGVIGTDIDGNDINLFKKYIDPTSITNYRRGLSRRSDNRVKVESSADIIAQGEINRFNVPRFRSMINISSNTYDVRTIKLGDLIGFRNFGNFVDDITMQVMRIDYTPDSVTLQLDTLLPSVPKRLEDIKRNLSQEGIENNPDAPEV